MLMWKIQMVPYLCTWRLNLDTKQVAFFLNMDIISVDSFDNDKCTPLHYAAREGHKRIVELLISRGADFDARNSHGYTPLVIAAKYVRKGIVKLLISIGANVVYDEEGWTLMHYASQNGWIDVVQSLVKTVDIDGNTFLGITELFSHLKNDATINGRLKIVQSLAQKVTDIDAKTLQGKTPLLLAAEYTNKYVVECLILAGANIDCCAEDKWTVLHHASRNGWRYIVEELVKKGTDVDAKTSLGRTPVLLAAETSHRHIVEYLIMNGANIEYCADDKWSVLHYASKNKWLEVVSYLLVKGLDINAKTSCGYTPLLLAAKYSDQCIVELLLKSGAKADFYGNDGWAFLHYASQNNWLEIVKSLLKEVAEINAKTSCGYTPLMLAAKHSEIDIVELLLELEANDVCDVDDKWTVLHYVSCYGWMELVRSLLKKGHNVNAKTSCDTTPILLAAQNSHKDVVELLLNFQANVNYSANDKWTVLHYASQNKWLDVVQSLHEKGADINARNSLGQTPLHLAYKTNNILKYLLKAGADCCLEDMNGVTPLSSLIAMIPKLRMPLHSVKKSMLAHIIILIKNGAYFRSWDYYKMIRIPFIKNYILKDTKLCSLAVINKFNNQDLPLLYKLSLSVRNLPPIEHFKIESNNIGIIEEVEHTVNQEIQTKGYCNLLKICPIVLRVLAIKSFLDHYNK